MKVEVPYHLEYMDRDGNSYLGIYVPQSHRIINIDRE